MHGFGSLVPLTFFLIIFGIVYTFLKTRSRERLALIDKGMDASLFYGDKKDRLTYWTLRLGALMLGFGVGLFVGFIMEGYYGEDQYIAPPIFIFAGLFWIAEFFVERKIIRKDNK